jgi:hypothetical protein
MALRFLAFVVGSAGVMARAKSRSLDSAAYAAPLGMTALGFSFETCARDDSTWVLVRDLRSG